MKKIIIDISILGNDFYKNNQRSGIFQCSKAMIDCFYTDFQEKLFFYSDIHHYKEVCDYVQKNYNNVIVYTNGNTFARIIQKFECFLKLKRINIKNVLIRKTNSFFLRVVRKLIDINCTISSEFESLLESSGCFLSPIYAIPDFVRKYTNIKNILFIYDLIPLKMSEYKGGMNGWFGQVYNSLNKNDYYFTISNFTKNDFIETCREIINPENVFNTYIGVSDVFKRNEDKNDFALVYKKYNLKSNKYIFSLCNIEERKNLLMQIQSFITFISDNKINDLYYLLGGGKSSFNQLLEQLNNSISPDFKQYIYYIGYVDDEDLPVLYSNAMWFTFTSKFEGFGLPPLEAMKCGCPVVTSNRTSLPEVCGDAALYVDSDSEEQHVEAFMKLYNNESLRIDLQKKGFEQVKQFQWKNIIHTMNEIIESL